MLQPLKTGDRQGFFDSIDEDVVHWQGYSAEYIESLRRNFPRNQGYWSWPCKVAVRDRVVDEFVGAYFVENINADGTAASLGWWLAAKVRGRGLGVESLSLVLDYVHQDMGIRRVIMGTADDNVRAVAQIRRSGATFVNDAEHQPSNGQAMRTRWFEHVADKLRADEPDW